MQIGWILNGSGLDRGVSGGPLRFHEVSSRWAKDQTDFSHILLTTSGGEGMLRKMGCTFPAQFFPASLLLKQEPFKSFRFWSYCLSACYAWMFSSRLPKVDVAITVSDYFCDIVPALVMKRINKKMKWIAWSYHKETHPSKRPGNRLINEITWRMQEWSFKQMVRHADSIWISDSFAGDDITARLFELGVEKSRIYRKKNGVDIHFINNVPLVEKKIDAVMIGVRPNKGMADIVPIWKEVQKRRPGTTLRLTGGMVPLDRLCAEIKQAGLDDVIEIDRPEGGYTPPAEYYRRIKEARVLFTPSREEGWGIAVCEALAMGMPVVAYNLPVFQSLFADTFLAVEFDDYSGFATNICRLLDDGNLSNQMAEHGKRFVTRYDWNAIAVQELNKFKQIMEIP